MQRPQADEKNEMGLIRGKSALHQVLEAVVKIEKGKVITGPADSVGLILYNVDVRHLSSSIMLASVWTEADSLSAGQVWSVVFGELQTWDLRLSKPPNYQCRGDKKGHQIDGNCQRAVPSPLGGGRGRQDCTARDSHQNVPALSQGQRTQYRRCSGHLQFHISGCVSQVRASFGVVAD